MGAAFLTPREAMEAGVPKATAYRVGKEGQGLSERLKGLVLVVDGAVLTTPDEIVAVMEGLAERALDAEHERAIALERATRLDQELQLARHELDAQRDRAAALNPRLAAMAAQITQILTENLGPPESRLPN